MTTQSIRLDVLLDTYMPGSFPQPWTWDDEEADILRRECCCCDRPGHYQQMLEDHLREHGLDQGVCLGDDGRVHDGHHRIVAARRLGIEVIPVGHVRTGAAEIYEWVLATFGATIFRGRPSAIVAASRSERVLPPSPGLAQDQ